MWSGSRDRLGLFIPGYDFTKLCEVIDVDAN